MSGLIECIPNVSEGRNQASVAACVRALASVSGVRVLDTHVDADHNRSVFTFVGDADAVSEAVMRLASVTTGLMDLRRHEGQHPRMGALDVVPFVPLDGVTMQQCIVLARSVAAHLAERFALPVFLYDHAALRTERRVLPAIRGRGFEAMRARGLAARAHQPDYGPHVVHPSAGATAVGARDFLLAFNVALATPDVRAARQIAREIRTSSGGLPGVRALGLYIHGRAQVSMNLIDLTIMPPSIAFDAVVSAANALGVEISGSEIVGLIPAFAARAGDTHQLRLSVPIESLILENRMAATAERSAVW